MNKKYIIGLIILCLSITFIPTNFEVEIKAELNANGLGTPIIADHNVVNYIKLDMIPDENITNAKETLHIAYQHTSHGSQIIDGMNDLPAYKESLGGTEGLFDWNDGGIDGALDIDDYFSYNDLGDSNWATYTETYLDNPANSDVNVIMWSWCGQVSDASESAINLYLSQMNQLEIDYPDVHFIYMTGHTDGSGLEGNLHIRNEQIRNYCRNNNKILFDFADIESYDPDLNYYGDKYCNDNCDYDSNNDTIQDANWAIDWQDDHPGEWYECGSAHSQPLNANMKAYAAWWLWAILAGWNTTEIPTPTTTWTPHPSPSFSIAFSGIILIIVSLTFLLGTKRKV
ncbi:MAG: hypothetical protein JXA54_09330 [Candidatus Heimdallarchaeota archaeon]|nr:hypothetical protein [Candidatus Heimdallarchaeota archaeon]